MPNAGVLLQDVDGSVNAIAGNVQYYYGECANKCAV
jgi:hypothetical protein